MPGIIVLLVFGLVGTLIVWASLSQSRQVRELGQLAATGIHARGLVLSVGQVGTTVVLGGRRYQRRSLVLDVEIPGQAPYEISAAQLIPGGLMRRILPGATIQVRVDPMNPQKLALVGPGATYFGATSAGGGPATYTPPMQNRSALIIAIPLAIVFVGGGIGLILFISTRDTGSHTETERPSRPTPTAMPSPKPSIPVVTPTPAATISGDAASWCAAAAECCRAISTSSACAAYARPGMSADGCKKAYAANKQAATALGKKCR
jgi:hypothetical protein